MCIIKMKQKRKNKEKEKEHSWSFSKNVGSIGVHYILFDVYIYNRRKHKKYHTLTHTYRYMTAHFPTLVQAFQ